MRVKHRALAALFVLALMAGCASNRLYRVSEWTSPPDSTLMAALAVPGSDITLRLVDGRQESGTVRAVLADGLVLGRPSNYGLKEIPVAYDDILEIEIPPTISGGAAGDFILVISGVALGLVALMYMALLNSSWD